MFSANLSVCKFRRGGGGGGGGRLSGFLICPTKGKASPIVDLLLK